MEKIIIFTLYIAVVCALIFVQIVVFIFNPVFMLETPNATIENVALAVHSLVFILFIGGSIYFGKKLWSRLNNKNKNGKTEILCTSCKHKGKPTIWVVRIIIGIIILIFPFGSWAAILAAIFYFMLSNPYYCPKCHKRDKLIKIVDGQETRIKALPKWGFILLSVLPLISLALITFMNLPIRDLITSTLVDILNFSQ